MRIHRFLALIPALAMFPALAQDQPVPGDVTFVVPLNLTRLAADITQVDVTCFITSEAIPAARMTRDRLMGHVVMPVAGGRVVTTANVVVAVPQGSLVEPAGKTANYECMLSGYSTGVRDGRTTIVRAGWYPFDETRAGPSFRLMPMPQPITGSFNW